MIGPGLADGRTTSAPPAARAAGDVAEDLPDVAPELGAVAVEHERRDREPVPWVGVCSDRERLRPGVIWRDPPTKAGPRYRLGQPIV